MNDGVRVRLRLKVLTPTAEVIETLLYGCVTRSSNKPDYDRLQQVHHSMLLRRLGFRKRKHERRSHPLARKRACQDKLRELLRRRCGGGRVQLAELVARMREERLPRKVMFGELVGGEGYSGGQ